MQRSTNLNMYLPENSDTQDITQISWNFDTLDGAVLTKSSQTLTSTQKSNVRTNLGLGTAATKDSVNNLTTTASGSVLDARVGPLLARTIYLTSSDDTWSEIWDKISVLSGGDVATIYATQNAIGVLTNGAITAGAYSGIIARLSSSEFSLMLKSTGNLLRLVRIQSASSSQAGTCTYVTMYQPQFKNLTATQGSTTFKIDENSKVRIDFVTTNANRMGTALIARTSGSVYARSDLGSALTLTTSTDSITVTATGGATAMQCTIYQGDITEATT